MRLGMPTLIETQTLENCAILCHELGLHFIELNMNLPQYQPEQMDIGEFLRVADKYGIYFTIHLEENLNPCDFNPSVANAYIQTAMQTIEIAKKLSVPVINMHLSDGVYFTLPNERIYLFNQYKDRYLQDLIAFRDKAEREIGDYDIKICIENSGLYRDFHIEGIDAMLKSPVFALTFDIGHSATHGGVDETVILKRQNRLHHMHLHDARGKSNHLALGSGELDLPKYISLANEHNCRIVLETKSIEGLNQSVKWMKDNL